MYSCFLRLLDRCDLELIQQFTAVNKINMNHAFLNMFNQHFRFTFWEYFLGINN